MNCSRAEELFSDLHEGALSPPLARELSLHLEACDECRELFRAFEELVDALRALPVPAPAHGFDELPGELARLAAARRRRFRPPPPRTLAAASWLAVAALLATIMIVRPPELTSELSRQAFRTARDVYAFAMRSYHQAEVWVEDLNVLRMTVQVAFEDRIDQINEQLRNLTDARRRPRDGEDEQSRDRPSASESSVAIRVPVSTSRSLS